MTNPKPMNVWNYKPWWCQPWSIVLTSAILIGGSWWVGQRIWLTGLVAIPVLTWMAFFLGVYPRLVAASADLPDRPHQEG